MKCFASLIVLCCFIATQGQQPRKDITKENLESLRGLTSRQLSVSGFYIGMNLTQARSILAKSHTLIGEDDPLNERRIYVYERHPEGRQGVSLLYLIWDKSPRLEHITVFEDAQLFIAPAFRPLFGRKRLDINSETVKKLLGKPDRSKVTLDTGRKQTTYEYCTAGFQITRKSDMDAETSVFALVLPRSRLRCAFR